MIPVNIVTGFLGSGKTTLLRDILQREEFSDCAVIVNEFGEVGLDHILLEEVEEGVLLLENGCICCTIRSDVQETIRDLHNRVASGEIPEFARIIIETTGLADPVPIVSTIASDPIIRNHFRIGNIICTADAQALTATLQNQPEAIKQISVADRILITKTDLVEPKAIAGLQAQIIKLNPIAVLGHTSGEKFDAELLFDDDVSDTERRDKEIARWLERMPKTSNDKEHHHGTSHADTIHSFTVSYALPIDWVAFGVWLTALLHAHGAQILRVKGILNVRESSSPVIIHGVQHVVHAPMHLVHWPDDERISRIVFITRGIEEVQIRQSLEVFLAMVSRVCDGAESGRQNEGGDQ